MTDRHTLPDNATPVATPPRAYSVLLLACALAVPGLVVLAVADLVASVVVGTAKIGGKVIGKTADVVLGSDEVPTAD
jgi:hypothetical protein